MKSPMDALQEGMDESLFLSFRERCVHLERGPFDQRLCSHPGNRTNLPYKDLPNCYLNACPIYERLEKKGTPGSLFAGFMARLGRLPK